MVALASKTPILLAFSNIIFWGGLVCAAIGAVWCLYQLSRFNPAWGAVSLLVAPLIYLSFTRLEHRQKSFFVWLMMAGLVITGLGRILVFSVLVCDADDECQPGMIGPYRADSDESAESSAFIQSNLDHAV